MALACGLPRVDVIHHPVLWSPDFPRSTCASRLPGRPVSPNPLYAHPGGGYFRRFPHNYTGPHNYTTPHGYTGEMLILLPPSEGKTPAPAGNAPVCFADLSFPELTAERESVLEELAAVSAGPDALAELKVGASLEAEVERNTRLLTEPAQPAIRTYTGVLFEALDYASFSPAERDAAHWSLLISSALWGILRPEDAIPAYRLSMGVKLGSVGALASF